MRSRENRLEREVVRYEKPHLYKALGHWHCRHVYRDGVVALEVGAPTLVLAFKMGCMK